MRFLAILLAATLLLPGQQTPAGLTRLNLVVVEGEGAINNIRQRTAREPIVQVEDENHKPVAGAAVVFTLPGDGASGSFANGARSLTVMTDNQGRAAARGFHPNSNTGQYQMRVTASKEGQTSSITINMSNVLAGAAGAAAGAGISAKVLAIIIAGAAAGVAGGVVAATRGNGNNNTVVTAQPTVITAGTGTVGPR